MNAFGSLTRTILIGRALPGTVTRTLVSRNRMAATPFVPASCGIGYREPTTILTEAHFLYYEEENNEHGIAAITFPAAKSPATHTWSIRWSRFKSIKCALLVVSQMGADPVDHHHNEGAVIHVQPIALPNELVRSFARERAIGVSAKIWFVKGGHKAGGSNEVADSEVLHES